MAGAVAIVIALVLFPVVFLMGMAAVAAIFGTTLDDDARTRYEEPEVVQPGQV